MRRNISGLMMIEMAFYLSAFGLFTARRVVGMWMKKTVNITIRERKRDEFFSLLFGLSSTFKWSSLSTRRDRCKLSGYHGRK